MPGMSIGLLTLCCAIFHFQRSHGAAPFGWSLCSGRIFADFTFIHTDNWTIKYVEAVRFFHL